MSHRIDISAVLPLIARDADMLTSAMATRYSTRKYSPPPISPEALRALQEYAEELSGICPDVRFAVGEATPESKLFKLEFLIRASFKNASNFCAGLVRMGSVGSDALIGLCGEMMILKAESLGVHTCWIGGTLRKGEILKSLAPGDNWTVAFITPLGNPETQPEGLPTRKRKDQSKTVKSERALSEWEQRAADAMTGAPSACGVTLRVTSVAYKNTY
eukprot:g10964.t1